MNAMTARARSELSVMLSLVASRSRLLAVWGADDEGQLGTSSGKLDRFGNARVFWGRDAHHALRKAAHDKGPRR